MISKIGVGILTVAALLIAVPSNVFAASSSADKAKIKKYYTQLKKLPNYASPAGKVYQLVTKLAKLDPKKSSKYYKVGLTKITPGAAAGSTSNKIAAAVLKILEKSGLPESTIKKQTKDVSKDNVTYGDGPSPTPVSPTAMLNGLLPVSA